MSVAASTIPVVVTLPAETLPPSTLKVIYSSEVAFVGTICGSSGSLNVYAITYFFSSPINPETTFAVGRVIIIPKSMVSDAFALPNSISGSAMV